MNPISPKGMLEISQEWDKLAQDRFTSTQTLKDFSYHHIIKPFIIESINKDKSKSIIDIGCGVGSLLQEIEKITQAATLTGVDPSKESLLLAKKISNAKLHCTTIEEYLENNTITYETAICCMVLMDTPNLATTIKAASSLLKAGGELIWLITHPYFWPKYWQYENKKWFNYQRETFIEAEFKIKGHNSKMLSTHIHRPLSMYLNEFTKNKLKPIYISEISAPSDAYPRFIGGKLIKE